MDGGLASSVAGSSLLKRIRVLLGERAKRRREHGRGGEAAEREKVRNWDFALFVMEDISDRGWVDLSRDQFAKRSRRR